MIKNFLKNYSTNLSGANLSGEVEDRDRWIIAEKQGRNPNCYQLNLWDKKNHRADPISTLTYCQTATGLIDIRFLHTHFDYLDMGLATLLFDHLAERYGYQNMRPVPGTLSWEAANLRYSLDKKYGTSHMEEYEQNQSDQWTLEDLKAEWEKRHLSGANLSGEVEDRDRWLVDHYKGENPIGFFGGKLKGYRDGAYVSIYDKELAKGRSLYELIQEEEPIAEIDYNYKKGKIEVENLWVDPEYQRMGIATLIFDVLDNSFGYENIEPVSLTDDSVGLRENLDAKYKTSHMERYRQKNPNQFFGNVNLSGEVEDRDRWHIIHTKDGPAIVGKQEMIEILDLDHPYHRQAGSLIYQLKPDWTVHVLDLEVGGEYQRMGIATLMFEVLDKTFGYENVIPIGNELSEDAFRLRADLDRKYGTSFTEYIQEEREG